MSANLIRQIACVVLGGMVGALIALPFSLDPHANQTWIAPAGFLMGLLLGYRKRNNAFFFYFCLIAAVVLACLLMGQMQQN